MAEPGDRTRSLRALVATVVPDGDEPRSSTEVVELLLALLRDERPDWEPRVDAVLADLADLETLPVDERELLLDSFVDDPEHRWLTELLGDLYHSRPRTWAAVGWRPGPTVDDVAPRDLDPTALAGPGDLSADYDVVVVVGSGAGGGIAAWRLAASGRRVLLVDRGGWPSTRELGRDHLRNPRATTGLDPLTGPRGDGDPRTAVVAGRRTTFRPGDAGWGANAMLLGGGTRVYGAQAWRFAPADFRMASRYGVPEGSSLADWPVDYDDLEPYYSQVEWELGVSGETGGDPHAGPRSRGFPMPPVHQTRQSDLLRRSAERLGLGTLPVPLMVNSREYDGRAACVHCAQCVGFSCPVDARAGTHNTALPRAIATGRCTVLPDARVERLVTGDRGAVIGVALVGQGATGVWRREIRAAEVVLAAGAIETARLLLASTSDRERQGIGNRNDQVGRHLQGHVYGGASAVFDEEVVDLVGPGPAIATCDFRHDNDDHVGGGLLANEFVPTPAATRRGLVAAGFVPPHGRAAQDGMRRWARRFVRVVGPVQEVTASSSRVRLDPHVRDRHGNAVVELSGTVHPEDRRTQQFLGRRAEEWLRASGAVRVARVGAPGPDVGPSAGQHQAGTCRMGTDPSTSVVDPFGRVWGHDNVRVVDASVHVTNGGVNPVLTVMAGAARIADHLVTGRTLRREP